LADIVGGQDKNERDLSGYRLQASDSNKRNHEMAGLKQLLIDLGRDAELADDYRENPKAVMKKYELDDRAVLAMLNNDVEAVKKLSGLDEVHSNGVIKAHEPK
jgi:hypothetical protein